MLSGAIHLGTEYVSHIHSEVRTASLYYRALNWLSALLLRA